MALPAESILAIPFEDTKQKLPDLLLHISNVSPSKAASGSNASGSTSIHELKFIATDGQAAFSGSLHSSRLSKYLHRDAGITVTQFEVVLRGIFFPGSAPPRAKTNSLADGPLNLDDIRITALWGTGDEHEQTSTSSGRGDKTSIRLRLSRNVHALSQTLATITLAHDTSAESELDMCEWVRIALTQGAAAEKQISTLTTRLESAEKDVEKVKGHVDELMAATRADQTLLLDRVGRVLDAKKARIRELESGCSGAGRAGRPWKEEAEDENGGENSKVKIEGEDDVEVVSGNAAAKGKGKGKGKAASRTTGTGRSATARATAKTTNAGPSRANKRKQQDLPPATISGDANQEIEYNGDENGDEDEEVALEDEKARQDAEENADTDREDTMQDQYGDLEGEEELDDLDELGGTAPSSARASAAKAPSTRSTRAKKSTKDQPSKNKQHTLRSKQSQTQSRLEPEQGSEDEMSTDDEL